MAKKRRLQETSPLDTVRRALTDNKLQPETFSGGTGFVVDFGDELYEGAIAHLIEEAERFVFYVEFRNKVPAAKQAEVAEFITRANYGIIIGNFEMDYDDGSVRYKSSVDYEGTELTYELIRNAIVAAREAVEVYGGPLSLVSKGVKGAKQAIEDVETASGPGSRDQ